MLKGTTKIELTNVKTGEVEVVQKENMVTNAVRDILTMNPFGYLYDAYYGTNTAINFSSKFLPVVPNLIGGILLFEDSLEEDPDKYYAAASNKIVGCSSNNASPGTSPFRGSMNLIESGVTEDKRGYRFVFDFATSQGNGVISSLGLTSKWGGVAGYGDEAAAERMVAVSDRIEIWYASYLNPSNPYVAKEENVWAVRIVAIDWEKNISYSVNPTAIKTIQIIKNKGIIGNQISLMDNGKMQNGSYIETVTLNTQTFLGTSLNPWYGAFVDGGDGFIYGFEHVGNKSGNASGVASVNWIKISMIDLSFTEGTWVLGEISLMHMGQWFIYTDNRIRSFTNIIVDFGYAYFVSYDMTAVYKVDLANPTNIVKIDASDKIRAPATNYGDYLGATMWNKVGNALFCSNYYLQNDTLKKTVTNENGLTLNHIPLCGKGPFVPIFTTYSFYNNGNGRCGGYRQIYLMTPYLATINNLATPVVKTADKTMKITYILTETEEAQNG